MPDVSLIDAQKQAADSLQFLSEASVLLSSSLDYETTLEAITRLAVPRLADGCSLEILGEDGVPQLVGVAYVDPAKVRLARELRLRYPPLPEEQHGLYQVLRTGRPELVADLPDSLWGETPRDAEHLHLVRELGLRSSLAVPLSARGRTLGVLQLSTAGSGRLLTPADLPLAEQLAVRAALAVDNARLYREAQEALRRKEEEQRLRETLQRVGMTLASELEPVRLMQLIADTAVSLTGASFGVFLEARGGEEGERFVLSTLSGAPRERFTGLPPVRLTPLLEPTFRGGATVLLADVKRHPAHAQTATSPLLAATPLLGASYLAVPLKSRSGEVLGGLFLSHPEAGRFLPVQARLVEGVAFQAAVALDNARLHQQARQSEERFRALVTAASQMVWSTQPDGVVVEDSPTWRAFTGQSYEDSRGFGWLAMVHPEDEVRVRRGWEAARALKKPYELELRVRRAQGEWAHTLARVVPLFDAQGQLREWIGTGTDTTAQRLAEEASRRLESEQRARQLESLRARINESLSREDVPAVLMQACTEALTRVMPALALVQLWSFDREVGLLRLEARAGLEVPAAVQPLRLELGEGFAGQVGKSRQGVRIHDVQAHASAGSRGWMKLQGLESYVGIPLLVGGRLVGVLSLFAQAPLEEETITTLATVADAVAQGLERRRAELALQSQVRGLTRSTEEPVRRPIEAGEALERALAHLGPHVQETGASVIQGRLPRVWADGTQLTQLFQNLVGNALKFQGATPPRVLVEAELQGHEWRFTVEDNGIGIEPRDHERILALFQRLRGPEADPGTGLALCKKIVERHGGRMGLDSQPGQGTTFWFTLPAVPARDGAAP